jgi:hypothetical protein
MMKKLQSSLTAAITAACLTLAACDDSPLAPERALPEAGAVPQQDVAAASNVAGRDLRPEAASVAVRDAIERVLPTFEPGSSTTAIGAGLTQALASLERRDFTGARQALRAADQSLDLYAQQAGKALGPDIDAVRLAIAAGL